MRFFLTLWSIFRRKHNTSDVYPPAVLYSLSFLFSVEMFDVASGWPSCLPPPNRRQESWNDCEV